MDAFYFDSSSVVKRFSKEAGTAWVLSVFKPSGKNLIYTARITSVEVIAALMRKNRTGNLPPVKLNRSIKRFERSLRGRYVFLDVVEPLLQKARDLSKRHGLRGYDAVQLAAALQVHRRRQTLNLASLIFVCADDALNAAAIDEGLAVENPHDYP